MSKRVETKKKATKTKQTKKEATKTQRRGTTKASETKAPVETTSATANDDEAASDEAAAKVPERAAALAFSRVQPELEAMPLTGLARITVSIPAAVSIGLGAVPNIEAKQDEMREQLPKYDAARAARLREYAYAAVYAHYRVALAAEGEVRLRALLDEAAPLRERLLRSAELFAHLGDFDAEIVAGIRRGNGHLDTANDLVELAMLFRAARQKIAGRSPVTDADVERAAELGDALLEALGRRRVGTDGAAAQSKEEEERAKAFWLFHSVYEESRRAMAHLRWYEGDADLLVPSLFLGRRRSSSTDKPAESPEQPTEPADPSESD